MRFQFYSIEQLEKLRSGECIVVAEFSSYWYHYIKWNGCWFREYGSYGGIGDSIPAQDLFKPNSRCLYNKYAEISAFKLHKWGQIFSWKELERDDDMSNKIRNDMIEELLKHDKISVIEFLLPMKEKHLPYDGAVLTHYWSLIKCEALTRTEDGYLITDKEKLEKEKASLNSGKSH